MELWRMHGIGNRFLILDGFRDAVPDTATLQAIARNAADPALEWPADGLLILSPADEAPGHETSGHEISESEAAGNQAVGNQAAALRIINADGSDAEMCGNGLRCAAALLFDRRYVTEPAFVIMTPAGPRPVSVLDASESRWLIRVGLGRPIFDPPRIPTRLSGVPPLEVPVSFQPTLTVGTVNAPGCPLFCSLSVLSLGNPHAVLFVEDAHAAAVLSWGPALEHHPAFPQRANIGFAEVLRPNELRLRVWERGVGETAACGTGAAAAVVAGILTGRLEREVTVRLWGGDLQIQWPSESAAVLLTGEAVSLGATSTEALPIRRAAA